MQTLPVLFLLSLLVQYLKQILDMTVWEVNRLMIFESSGQDVIDQVQSEFRCVLNVVISQQQPN